MSREHTADRNVERLCVGFNQLGDLRLTSVRRVELVQRTLADLRVLVGELGVIILLATWMVESERLDTNTQSKKELADDVELATTLLLSLCSLLLTAVRNLCRLEVVVLEAVDTAARVALLQQLDALLD